MSATVLLKCDVLAQETWEYCIEKQAWISTEHILGRKNSTADFMSHTLNKKTKWSLSSAIFLKIVEHYSFQVEIDLFAIYSNKQIPRYVLWHPVPFSYAVDAFNLNWKNLNFCALSSFNLTGKLVSKIIREQALGIMIIPHWPTQNWFPLLAKCLINFSI